jgi:hypothetical protein
MLHAASLVVDDLPALDNTSERRGRLSLHKRFGEAAAVLTAHALVAAAFEIVAQIPSEPLRLLRITRLLAASIGARGMCLAELVDPGDSVGSETEVRGLKTGSLFQMAAQIGAVLAGAEAKLTEDLGQLGLRLGTCYQLADDLRDEIIDHSTRGGLCDAGRRSWEQCAELISLLRGRLHTVRPVEAWMSWFQDAGAKILDTHEFAPSNEQRPQLGCREAGVEEDRV